MRVMSFHLTADLLRRREKTRTRRTGWRWAKPGDRVLAVVKARGVKVADRQSLGVIEFVDVAREPFDWRVMTAADIRAEGFGYYFDTLELQLMTAARCFGQLFRDGNRGSGWKNGDDVTRIDFRFVDD